MSAEAPEVPRLRIVARRGLTAGTRWLDRLEVLPVPRVLAALVVAQWLVIVAIAHSVRHNGWVYYQGGDQLWYYTLGWLLAHGHLGQTSVGYGWPVLLAPIARIAGPDLVSALPAIVLFNVLLLVPVALFALYGIAARIGGRLFGYWAVLLWILVPLIGIKYADAGYHQRYTELTLPQSLGLTGMADFPTTVAALVSLYFCTRALFSRRPELLDWCAAGAAAGIAIAIKPSTSLILAGPALAVVLRRRLVGAAAFLLGIAPAVVTLTLWKGRGLGKVPLLSGAADPRVHGLASAAPLGFLNLGRYTNTLSWSHLTLNIDLLREHFWSGRLIVWLVLAGLIALGRRSRTALALIGGSFLPFVLIKGSYTAASVEDASIFRILMPCYPLFILLLASLPLLLPHAPAKLREWQAGFPEPKPRTRAALLAATVLLCGAVPFAAFAAARTGAGGVEAATVAPTSMPVPVNVELELTAHVTSRGVTLRWNDGAPLGGKVFYRISRTRGDHLACASAPGARSCTIALSFVGLARSGSFVDHPQPGRWIYRIGLAANWLDDPQYGDVYLVGSPLAVRVP